MWTVVLTPGGCGSGGGGTVLVAALLPVLPRPRALRGQQAQPGQGAGPALTGPLSGPPAWTTGGGALAPGAPGAPGRAGLATPLLLTVLSLTSLAPGERTAVSAPGPPPLSTGHTAGAPGTPGGPTVADSTVTNLNLVTLSRAGLQVASSGATGPHSVPATLTTATITGKL